MTDAMTTQGELLPCPFCGGRAEIERRGTAKQSCIIACEDCGCRLETGEIWSMGERWNTRATPPGSPLIAEREALPRLTRQFDLMRKGAKNMGLGSGWEDDFSAMQDAARAGTITTEQIVELIDSDYRSYRDGRAALTLFIDALLKDALTPSPSPTEREGE